MLLQMKTRRTVTVRGSVHPSLIPTKLVTVALHQGAGPVSPVCVAAEGILALNPEVGPGAGIFFEVIPVTACNLTNVD